MSTGIDQRIDLAELAAALVGTVHLPGSNGYAALATPWNLSVAVRPLAVVEAAERDDVVAAVRWARRSGVQVAAQATGHGAADVLEGVLLIHTGHLSEIAIDDGGSARVGSGVIWGQLNAAAAPLGLAPLGGSAPSVGVVGLLTGGGLGPLARTFGLCSDRVTAFDVVTGDGVLRRATAELEPELFWGLRGGKGALGIVTAVDLKLLPLTTVYAGALFFDACDSAVVLHAWAAWCTTLPEEATTSIALLQLPSAPGIPAPIAGRRSISVRFAWTGDPDQGEAALAPIRTAANPIFGGTHTMPAASVGAIHGDPVDPVPSHERAAALESLPPAACDALLAAAGPDSGSSLFVVEVRQLGGRVQTGAAAPSVFPGRGVAFSVLAIGIAAGPAAADTRRDAHAVVEALAPWSARYGLPNFEPATTAAAVEATYPRHDLSRLGELIGRFDPDRILRAADPFTTALES